MSEKTIVGQPIPLLDAVARVTGQTRFAADVHVPGALFGRILYSRHPHARILRIDTGRAEALPGVRAVISAADAPDRTFGLVNDRWVFARDETRYIGDRVAAVAADDAATAEAALALIEVDYEPLPTVADASVALGADAPIARADRAWRYRETHPELGPNVAARTEVEYGDVERAFAKAALVVEEEYRTPRVHHSYLEPKSSTAEVDRAGNVTVWTTTQGHHSCRDQIARALDLPASRIRVIPAAVGGGFGGKGEALLEPIAVLLARKAGRPVKLTLTRYEEMIGTQVRPPVTIRIRSAVSADGLLLGREFHAIGDVGCAHDWMIPDLKGGGFARGPYRISNLRASWTDVYTNSLMAAAFRAPRAPQSYFATESHLDTIARALGIDPLEIRRRNGPTPDEPEGADFAETLGRVAEQAGWNTHGGSSSSRHGGSSSSHRAPGGTVDAQGRRLGWGFACCRWDTWANSVSSALIEVNLDGTVVVNTGSVDISGSHTALAQIAAERLQISLDRLAIVSGDSSLSPYADSTGGSRTVYATGRAVLAAAEDALTQLGEAFAEETGARAEALIPREGGSSSSRQGGLVDPVSGTWRDYGTLARVRLASGKGPVIGRGSQSMLPAAPIVVAQAAQVAVDEATGQVTLERLIVGQSVGQAVNPLSVEGQLAGGAAQGVGFALTEEHLMRAGYVLNPTLADYHLPTAQVLPRIETIIVAGEPAAGGAYGARGVGEPSCVPTAPAIANAVRDATGVGIRELPLTPERVYQAIRRAGLVGALPASTPA